MSYIVGGSLCIFGFFLMIISYKEYAAKIVFVSNGDKPPKQNFVELDDQNTNV